MSSRVPQQIRSAKLAHGYCRSTTNFNYHAARVRSAEMNREAAAENHPRAITAEARPSRSRRSLMRSSQFLRSRDINTLFRAARRIPLGMGTRCRESGEESRDCRSTLHLENGLPPRHEIFLSDIYLFSRVLARLAALSPFSVARADSAAWKRNAAKAKEVSGITRYARSQGQYGFIRQRRQQ